VRAIGLDLYRDLGVGEGRQALRQLAAAPGPLISVFSVIDAIGPIPGIPPARQGRPSSRPSSTAGESSPPVLLCSARSWESTKMMPRWGELLVRVRRRGAGLNVEAAQLELPAAELHAAAGLELAALARQAADRPGTAVEQQVAIHRQATAGKQDRPVAPAQGVARQAAMGQGFDVQRGGVRSRPQPIRQPAHGVERAAAEAQTGGGGEQQAGGWRRCAAGGR
jgi:hypothetical protein